MNGAANSYHQQEEEEDHRGLRRCSEGSEFNPGYHLDMMNLPQHSKAMNFDNHSIDTYQYKHGDQYSNGRDYQSVYNHYEGSQSHRYGVPVRVPLDLPVPNFEIDENYVGEPIWRANSVSLPRAENSNELDLDTRINFLIKTKALAGMHPIFSQLESEESESDDSFRGGLGSRKKKRRTRSPLPIERVESFDDPEMPLSRPPSPFLTRATYLFWFNKAIELKKQAKAQEQELLEKAAKKLLQEQSTSGGKTGKDISNHKRTSLPKNVLDEVCSELKEIVKNEFIKEVFKDVVFNTLEQWWESNCQNSIAADTLHTATIGNSTSPEICSSEIEMNENLIKTQEEIKEKVFDRNISAFVEGQACSTSIENSVESSRSNTNSNKDGVSVDESDCGHQNFKPKVVPRINQPVLDESSLFLPFATSSNCPVVLAQRLDKNDEDEKESVNIIKYKNDCVVNVLNTIMAKVFQTIGI